MRSARPALSLAAAKTPSSSFLRTAVLIFIVLSPLLTTVGFGSQVQQFSVDPGYSLLWTANLSEGDKFSGSFSISGGSGNDINFWITDPTGGVILNQGRISQGTSFAFTAATSGGYVLHFDNSFSLFSGKAVTLTYDITSSIATILTVALLVVIVVGSGAGLFYLRVRKKKGSATPSTTIPPPKQ